MDQQLQPVFCPVKAGQGNELKAGGKVQSACLSLAEFVFFPHGDAMHAEPLRTPTPSSIPKQADARVWQTRHDVTFYREDSALAPVVARFLSDGIRSGQPTVVIATASHRVAFTAELERMGIDVDEVHHRDLVWLDAHGTLSAFMEGGRPNAELFEATVGNVLEKILSDRRYVTVRAYGEMVDILWREGKHDAAIELEALWNELAEKYAFTLLCAYDKKGFAAAPNSDGVTSICMLHTSVIENVA